MPRVIMLVGLAAITLLSVQSVAAQTTALPAEQHESPLLIAAGAFSVVVALAWFAHFASYRWIKERTLKERKWDYNICCGTTDGGGINADIMKHGDIPRFELVQDVTKLPHPDKAFEHVLCSHTIEHVPDPDGMFRELRRIGRHVTILVPPLWDFTAALNPFEHQTIFLSMRSRHENKLPRYVRFNLARWLQAIAGQRINADTLAGQGTRKLAKWMDLSVPLSFSAAAGLAFTHNAWAWCLVGLGCAAFCVSKRSPKH